MKTLNIEFKDIDSFKEALKSANFPLTSKNILVKIFCGNYISGHMNSLLKLIKKHIPNGVTFGATTAGELCDDKILTKTTVISITYFEKSTVKIKKIDKDYKDSFDLGKKLADGLKGENLKVIILALEGLNSNGEDFLNGIESNSDDIYLSGGLAGNDYEENGATYLFYEDEIITNGAVGVGIYSKELYVDLKYTYSWDAIGREFKVNKSKKNVVQQIDGMKPKDLYLKYFGQNTTEDFLTFIRDFPLLVKRNGLYISRAGTSINEEGDITYNADINEGEYVRFGIGNVNKIINSSIDLYDNIYEQWESIFIYSCSSRKKLLRENTSQDTLHFTNICSLNGFFTFGEFYKIPNKKATFFNQTLTILMLSENKKYISHKKAVFKDDKTLSQKALSNLIESVTKENNDITTNLNNIISTQIDKIKEQNSMLKKELYYDSLTRLKNRNSLFKDMKTVNLNCLLLIDIQGFSTINDLYGEKVGNILLENFSVFLINAITDCAFDTYRLAGNTFALVSPLKKKTIEYQRTIKELIKNIEMHNFSINYNGVALEFAINVRAGLATRQNSTNMIENADMALNRAKKTNKDFVIYNKSLEIEKSYEKDLNIIKTVKKALAEDRIIPYVQPIHKNNDIQYESLVRLILEDGTVLPPSSFLQTVKNTRLYFQLTKRMIEKTFEIFQNLPYKFSINLSYLDIQNIETIPFLKSMLKKYNIKNQLTIEFTESDIFHNYNTVKNFLNILRKLNIQISVDDFGSGYSNFSHLITINPDYIKLDGSLIKNVNTDKKLYAVVKAIVSFAKDINIKIIAEFIHSKSVYETIKALNIDGYQGYFLGKPEDPREIF